MGREAYVLSSERVVDEGAHMVLVKCEPDGVPAKAQLYTDPGVDSMPLPEDFVALEDSAGEGAECSTGAADTRNEGKAAPGEIRLYARNAQGEPVSEVWLKGDGSIRIENASGHVELLADGTVDANGARITTDGEVIAKFGAQQVSLSQLKIPSPMGLLGPPVPGV